MAEIRPRIAAADAAGAINRWAAGLRRTRVLDEHAAFAGVEAGMTCGASGQHAIHHVNAKRDVIGDLFGAANAHEIARAVFRKEGGDFGSHGTSDFVRLAHGEAADGVTGEVEIEKLAGAFTAQVGESCALHDAKLPLLDWRAVAVSGFLKRSEKHTSELQSRLHLVCRLLLGKKTQSARAHEAGRRPRLARGHVLVQRRRRWFLAVPPPVLREGRDAVPGRRLADLPRLPWRAL